MNKKHMLALIGLFLLLLIIIFNYDKSDSDDIAEDNNKTTITSCDTETMQKIGISTLDWNEESDICNIMVSGLNRNPPVYLLRKLFKLVSAIQMNSDENDTKDIAYQAMNIVEARGQENNDIAIDNTFETIWKIYQRTEGHVTFKDLNITLRHSGEVATKISDEGLIGMGILLWEDKKAEGE